MAAAIGRDLTISYGGTTVAAVTSKSVSINSEPVDITSDDDSGFRTLLEDPASRSIDLSVEGVMTTDALLGVIGEDGATTFIGAVVITFPSGATISGNFRFNSYEVSGEVAGRVQFSATLQSTGTWTYASA